MQNQKSLLYNFAYCAKRFEEQIKWEILFYISTQKHKRMMIGVFDALNNSIKRSDFKKERELRWLRCLWDNGKKLKTNVIFRCCCCFFASNFIWQFSSAGLLFIWHLMSNDIVPELRSRSRQCQSSIVVWCWTSNVLQFGSGRRNYHLKHIKPHKSQDDNKYMWVTVSLIHNWTKMATLQKQTCLLCV